MSDNSVSSASTDPVIDARPFHELRDSGLLWLINRVVFHPRGWALSLVYRKREVSELASGGEVLGWKLVGDGTEVWTMVDPSPELIEQGHKTEDELFALVQALLSPKADEASA